MENVINISDTILKCHCVVRHSSNKLEEIGKWKTKQTKQKNKKK